MPGSPLMEIGNSPTPKTHSMLNCPGWNERLLDCTLGLEPQGKCVRRLLGHRSYRVRLRKHRVGCDCGRHDYRLTAYTSSNCKRVASSRCSMIWANRFKTS